jgi:hypothetical protein
LVAVFGRTAVEIVSLRRNQQGTKGNRNGHNHQFTHDVSLTPGCMQPI